MRETLEPAGQMALTHGPQDPDPVAATICTATRDETVKRLQAVSGSAFFAKLQSELNRRLKWQFAAGQEVQDLLTLAMALNDPGLIQKMLYGVRTAMADIVFSGSVESPELAAAAGLHYIGFRQLVRCNRIAPGHGEYLLPLMKVDAVQNPAHQAPQLIIAAFVVSAVFGGLVEFEAGGLTRSPSHMRGLIAPENADGAETAIDRALFAAWFPADQRAPPIADGTLQMTDGDYSRLKARISQLRDGDEVAAGVWVTSGAHHQELLSSIGKKFQIPILLETSVAVQEALGMSASDFLAQMGEYWRLDTELRQTLARQPQTVAPESATVSTQGGKPMSSNTYNTTNITTTGSAQIQVGGSANTNQQVTHNGLDAAALSPLLNTLASAISALADPHAKAAYQTHLKTLTDESKALIPDKSKMSTALEKLKNAPDYLKGGEAIVKAATSLYDWITPFLTVNPVLTA